MLFMKLDSMRIRLALMGVGLVAALVIMGATGKLGGKPKGVIAIEFGAYPDEFAGLEVEIDGQVVGKLRMVGAQTRNGFAVGPGTRQVRVIGPRWNSTPRPVEVQADRTMMFVLNVGEGMRASGATGPELVLQ